MFPEMLEAASPYGIKKAADVPTPSAHWPPPLLDPAKVETAPVAEMERRRPFAMSATKMVFATGKTLVGKLKPATVPCPSAHPAAPLPASVLTFQ
jgi:hypothetical protein